MKKLSILLLTSMAFVATAFAELEVPRKSYPVTKLDEAKAYALEKGKPLVFVNT